MKQLLILGTGCSKCRRLYQLTQQAAAELGVPHEIQKVTDLQQIMTWQVTATPALVVDGLVKVAGRVPSVEEIKKLLVRDVERSSDATDQNKAVRRTTREGDV